VQIRPQAGPELLKEGRQVHARPAVGPAGSVRTWPAMMRRRGRRRGSGQARYQLRPQPKGRPLKKLRTTK
jgi:hypothetical protein